jgi:predicted RNA-binding protein
VEEKMILIPEMEDVIYSHVAEEKIQSQTIMKLKEI